MKASDNVFPKVLIGEGVEPATPDTGEVVMYAKTDGKLYAKDDAGTETELGGGGMTNPMTTAGDIITGGTSGAAQRLGIGSDGQVLKVVSGAVNWADESGGGGSDNITIVTEASTSTMDPATHSGRSKLILAADDVTFDSTEGYTAGDVFNIRATAALTLAVTGVTLTPPAGGTLSLDADMTVTVAMTGATTGVVIGHTVAA